ncbi:MAG: RHS repeat-associated core domain-containing protein, partial [Candidatus Kapabacteria bacterium]|nr:RHS repeat-associated core domain-containing protein [Candidatus Kapabacteria bacterium]
MYTGEAQSGGLVYLRARYYGPQWGRFLTRDPLMGQHTQPQTFNPYAYVTNNPINLIDPSGLRGVWPWNQYRMMVMKRLSGVDIAAHKIGKREIFEIIKNFEGNPHSGSVEAGLSEPPRHPADIFCYDNDATEVRR